MTELGSSNDPPGVPSHPRTLGEVDDSTDRDEQLSTKSERLRSFMRTGGEVVGQVAGVAVSAVAGPVVGAGSGALLGDVFARVGLELYDRLLAPRQGARAAGALDVAWVRVEERLKAGDEPRDDGFFDPGPDGRPDAEEVLEGTLLTAANSNEERKVPLIGRLYANLAFDATVSPGHANFLLRLADRLTYRQLVALGFVAQARSGDYQRDLAHIAGSGRLPDPGLVAEMNDLSDARVLGLRQADGTVISPQGTWDDTGWRPSNLPQAALTPVGETLHDLLELDGLPRADLDAVLRELQGGSG
jgi:hypothetical protein